MNTEPRGEGVNHEVWEKRKGENRRTAEEGKGNGKSNAMPTKTNSATQRGGKPLIILGLIFQSAICVLIGRFGHE